MEDLQETYDIVISGTGLTEQLVSGCLANARKNVINFDKNQDYGGLLKTKGIHDFVEWAQENGTIYTNNISKKLSPSVRNFSYEIDLYPLVVLSRDDLIDVLINSKTIDCLTTYLMEDLYFRTKDSFALFPSSKSTIFSNKAIPLRQKRILTKFLTFFLPSEDYGHTIDTSEIQTKYDEFQDKPFKDFLTALSFNSDLCGAFEYLLAMASQPLLTKEAVPRIRSFLSSFGRYGPTPFINFAYGASDIPQVFARYSAIWGTPYCLDEYPVKIERDEEKDELVLQFEQSGTIRTKIFIANPENVPSTGEKRFLANREILIMDRKMFESDRAIAVIPPGILNNTHPVYIFQYDNTLKCCENDKYLIHISSMGEVHEATKQLIEEIRIANDKEKLQKKQAKEAQPSKEDTTNETPSTNPTNENTTTENPQNENTTTTENAQNENTTTTENHENEIEDDPYDFIILHAGFTLTEDVPIQIKGMVPVPSPSLEQLILGTNYFVKEAAKIVHDLFPELEFYPPPTEVEVEVDEEPAPKETGNSTESKPEEEKTSTNDTPKEVNEPNPTTES